MIGDRPAHLRCEVHAAAGLQVVGGGENGHVRENPHERDLFQGLVGCAIRPDRDSAVCPADLHVQVRVADCSADLIPGPACHEDAVSTGEGDLSGAGKPGAHAEHVLFGDPRVEEPVRELLPEPLGACGLGQVRVHDHDIGVGMTKLHQRLPVAIPGGLLVQLDPVLVGKVRSEFSHSAASCSRSSCRASASSSAFGHLPCQSATSSMNDTPLPFTVWARSAVGPPL